MPLMDSFSSSWQFLADLKAPARSPLFLSIVHSCCEAQCEHAMPVWCQQWGKAEAEGGSRVLPDLCFEPPVRSGLSTWPRIFAVWNALQKCKFSEPGLSTKSRSEQPQISSPGFSCCSQSVGMFWAFL